MYRPDASTGEFLRAWLEQYVWQNRERNTYNAYEAAVRLHIVPLVGDIPLTELKALDVEQVLRHQIEQGYKQGTVQLTHRTLKTSLEFALNLGLVQANVARAVAMPRMEKKRPPVLSADEAAQLIHYAPGRVWYGRAIATVLLSGLRLGELRGLRWRNVDMRDDWAEIHVREQQVDTKRHLENYQPNLAPLKTVASERSVQVGDLGRQILSDQRLELGRWKAERSARSQPWFEYDLVFPGKNGGVNTRGVINTSLRTACRELDIPVVTVHGLRHTYATLLHEHGEDIVNIQHALGHRRVSVTVDMYVHPNDAKQRGVAGRLQGILQDAGGGRGA